MKKVFLKIYLIWFMRRIVPLMVLEIAVLVIALKTFAAKVFVEKVLENAAGSADANYWEFFQYLATAFLKTNILVQGAILILLGVGALLLRDIAKTAKTYLKTVLNKKEETKQP